MRMWHPAESFPDCNSYRSCNVSSIKIIMKLFKYSILAISAAVASMAFTSCDGDKAPDYEPGNPANGVFFPTTNAAKVEVTNSTTSVPVVVERRGETGAASYNVIVTTDAPEGVFTLPTSVSFGDGETTTNLQVPCNLADQVAGTSYVLNFALGADVPSFSYGSGSYSLTVSIPEAWSEWKTYKEGICTWSYDLNFMFSGLDPDLPIKNRYNTVDANREQFMIEHWGQNTPLTINYDKATGYCYIPFGSPTGATVNVSGMGVLDMYISDAYTFGEATGQADPKDIGASTFNPETGLFELAVVYYVIRTDNGQPGVFDGSYGYETCQVGEFKDFSVNFIYQGVLTTTSEDTFAQFKANVGADCSEAKIMISDVMSAQQIVQAIVAGNENAVSVAPGENQIVQVPVGAAGKYTAAIVSFDGETAKNAMALEFNVVMGSTGSQDWTTVSTGMIVDGWITAPFAFTLNGQEVGYEDLPWTFEMQKHKTQDGVYRMRAPWIQPEAAVIQAKINENTTDGYNIVIDASNPNLVKIEPQISGFKSNESPFNFTTAADGYYVLIGNAAGMGVAQYGMSDAEIIEQGWNDTQLADGIITCEIPLFGSSEKFGYNWNMDPVPYAMVALNANPEQAPAKKLGKMLDLRAKAKVASMLSIKRNIDFNAKFISKDINKDLIVRVK